MAVSSWLPHLHNGQLSARGLGKTLDSHWSLIRQGETDRQSALDRRLLPGARCYGLSVLPVTGLWTPRPKDQRRNVSDRACQHLSTLPNSNYPASCHREREGNIFIPIFIEGLVEA